MGLADQEIVISTPLRTAIGTFGGQLKDMPAVDLGVTVVKEVLNRSGLDPEQVNSVILGNVLQGGQGMNPARQVSINSGLPDSVPAMAINRVCGSGLQAICSAALEVAMGESDVVLAGGFENMNQAPYLLPKGRFGYRMGNGQAIDEMVNDGLWDAFNNYHMGVTAENVAEQYGITREECDAYGLRSHHLSTQAIKNGYFADQIVPVEIPQRKGDPVEFTEDEHVRMNATEDGFAKLQPVFKEDGVTTAGNASGINDGASAMLVTTRAKAEELGVPVAGRLVSFAVAGVDPALMGIGPVPAVRDALGKANLSVDDISVFEENEAFASVALAVQRELGIPDEKLNPVGGAVSLGHPIGATGAVLATKLLYELARQDAQYGVVTLCIGGGMGIAGVFERSS